MKIIDSTEIEVCEDCVFLLANGEVTDGLGNDITEQHAEKVSTIWGSRYILIYDGEDSFFGWTECDGCGDKLGGTRYNATAIQIERSNRHG